MPNPHEKFVQQMSDSFGGLSTRRRLLASELLALRVLDSDEATGTAKIEFTASDTFCNAMGTIQGGFLTAMLDDAMGIAGTVASGMNKLMLTHELKTTFIRAATAGVLVAEAKAIYLGNSIAFLEGQLRDEDNNLIATCSTTARPITPKPHNTN